MSTSTTTTSILGTAVSRIDGKFKVTGAARYAADHPIQGMVYGVPVPSTIGRGRITSINTAAVEKMPGVLLVLHCGNMDPLYHPASGFEQESRPGESRAPLEDDVIYYYGQIVALVVAQTFEQALDAAARVKVEYKVEKPLAHMSDAPPPKPGDPPIKQFSRGDAEAAFNSAPVKIDVTYTTPVETHNAMEMHATTAQWDGDYLTLYETTQGVVNHHNVMSQVLGVPKDHIRIISPYCGSGFGSKLFPWPQSALAAVAARRTGKPVKVTVPRALSFTTVGHRPLTQQRLRLGATPQGKLLAINHDVLQPTSFIDDFMENVLEPTPFFYSCANIRGAQHLVKLNIGTPTPMRGPGTTPGLFGLESAMDELAIKLNMDPLKLRLLNYADKDESNDLPYSSKFLRECFQQGAERFGWDKRSAAVGSMRKGDLILGWGMGAATWPANRTTCEARVSLRADGTIRASSATQDIGTGTYTVFAQIVSDKTGVPLEKIEVALGDSSLTPGPMSGGSHATASVVPAVGQATDQALQELFLIAVRTPSSPFANAKPESLKMTAGRVHSATQSPSQGVPFEQILKLRRFAAIAGQVKTGPGPEEKKYSTHSYGAHFCEVTWDPEITRLRITRWVTAIDAGRVINTKTASNQILGGVVMGIGMGMFEETFYDPRNAKPVNNNFADYIVPSHADIPKMDCIFVDSKEPIMNEYGVKGVGEIGLTGVASALTMAVYHATGIRVRDLPIKVDKLLA